MAIPPSSSPDNAHLDPLQLQAYFDDELSEEERLVVEEALEQQPKDKARLECLEELGELSRFELEQSTEGVALDLWSSLEPLLDTSVSEQPQTTSPFASVWEKLKRFIDDHRIVLAPTLAASAVALIFVAPMLMNDPPPERIVETERTVVIVEPLRFEGGSAGAVSYTPENNTPVIWYLGDSPTTQNKSQSAPPNFKKLRYTIPVQKILERLERLESLAWPGNPGVTPSPVPPKNPADWFKQYSGGTL